MRGAFRAHTDKTSRFADLLKSGTRRDKISEAKRKDFAPARENEIHFAFGWYDALTTWPPYHPYLDIDINLTFL